MSTYDDEYDDNRFQNLLSAYRPRAWKDETALDVPAYSRPEPTSKTNIPSKSVFSKKLKSSVQPYA